MSNVSSSNRLLVRKVFKTQQEAEETHEVDNYLGEIIDVSDDLIIGKVFIDLSPVIINFYSIHFVVFVIIMPAIIVASENLVALLVPHTKVKPHQISGVSVASEEH